LAALAQIELPVRESARLRFEPELEVLLACGRLTSSKDRLAQILDSSLNWDRVLKHAEHHRLMPVLWASVRNRNEVPKSILAAIQSRFQNHARRTLRFSAEQARIIRHFEHHEIRTLAHKGPALAQLLYGDQAMRQFGDLDFLLRAEDVPRARSALTELGYEPRIQLSPRQEQAYLRSGYEYGFGLQAERNLLELQWRIVPHFYAIDFDMEALFARSVAIELGGFRAQTLGNEDLMLVLCVHAAKHEWAQLGMVRDIATLAHFELDWEWIAAEARRLGILRILQISLVLARNLLSSELPLKFFPSLREAEELSAIIQSRLTNRAPAETESLRYFRAMMRVRERWRDRARLAWRLASTSSVGEWQTIGIPDSFFFLYGGVRMFRLIRRLCSRS